MKNKIKVDLIATKELVITNDDGTVAILSEGTKAHMSFNIKNEEKWIFGIVVRLCPKTMLILDINTKKNHKFSYEQLIGVSDKCPI